MGCHCREISIIEHDLSVINRQITKLNSIITQSEDIKEKICKSADKFDDNINVKSREQIVYSLKTITLGQTEGLNEAKTMFSTYTAHLKDKLQSLKSSDRRYHESKKHHNKG